MVIFGFTFVSVLFTLYSSFRYILQNEIFFLFGFLLHINFSIFFVSIMLVVIFWSSLLTKEVSMNELCDFSSDSSLDFCLTRLGKAYCLDRT